MTPEGMSTTFTVPDGRPANLFAYGPTVTGLEPKEGPETGGTIVTIHGSGFTSAPVNFRGLVGPFVHTVDFGSRELDCGEPWPPWDAPCGPISFTVLSDTEITATAPPGSGTVDLQVLTDGGISPLSAEDRFTYAQAAPSVGPGPGLNRLHLICSSARTARGRLRTKPQSCPTPSILAAGEMSGDLGGLGVRLLRGDVVYAKGRGRRLSQSRIGMVLEEMKQVKPGRYRVIFVRIKHDDAHTLRQRWSAQVLIR